MTFEAVPPGQQPTSITPSASSFGSEKASVSNQASKGMMVNCARQPIRMSVGRLSTILKSFGESVSPIPNMMTPSIGLMVFVSIQMNEAGMNKATAATKSTNKPIHCAIKSQTFLMLSVVCCLLSVVRRPLSVVRCPLSVVCCLSKSALPIPPLLV